MPIAIAPAILRLIALSFVVLGIAVIAGPAWADAATPADHSPVNPPPGYATVFDDGRLNPDRARGTAKGGARMSRVWTSTVPRRLVAPPQRAPDR